MAEDAYVGLCDTSHSDGTRSLAVFEQWDVTDTLAADINNDGQVDFYDYAILASQWLNTNCGATEWCEGADLDMSGTVDCGDLAIFVESW
jgi:hypothetical protein